VSDPSGSLRPPVEVAEALTADPELETSLTVGKQLFAEGKVQEAHAAFGGALRRRSSDPRCRSWYGLTLILVEHNNNLGIRYCEEAVRASGGDSPESWLNLARACRALGYRERAIKAIERGLQLEEGHPPLRAELESLGERRRPVIGFLSRSHPLNRLFGRLRYKLMPPAPPKGQ
jgi:tetratricopeptide (TPR) repeat protein